MVIAWGRYGRGKGNDVSQLLTCCCYKNNVPFFFRVENCRLVHTIMVLSCSSPPFEVWWRVLLRLKYLAQLVYVKRRQLSIFFHIKHTQNIIAR